MRRLTFPGILVLSAMLALAGPRGAAAQAEPEKLETPDAGGTYVVRMVNNSGQETDVFGTREAPTFEISFVLAMSATDKYPLSLTLVEEWGKDRKKETPIWSGTLEEGFYRLVYPHRDTAAASGEVKVRVVMRVRMYGERFSGKSTYQYSTWEGAYRIGKR